MRTVFNLTDMFREYNSHRQCVLQRRYCSTLYKLYKLVKRKFYYNVNFMLVLYVELPY